LVWATAIYFPCRSRLPAVASDKATQLGLSPCPSKACKITVPTRKARSTSFVFSILRPGPYAKPCFRNTDTLYFHAQYPTDHAGPGLTNQGQSISRPQSPVSEENLHATENSFLLESKASVPLRPGPMSVLQNQDGWWGEGDERVCIAGEKASINANASEDYFPRTWDVWAPPFSYASFRRRRSVGAELRFANLRFIVSTLDFHRFPS